MRRRAIPGWFVVTFTVVAGAGAAELTATRTVRESIAVELPSATRLIVDNIWGSIDIRGFDGEAIELVAHETIRARTSERIDQARNEVKLDIRHRPGEIELYVDGPFRCGRRNGEGVCWNEWNERYTVAYDFEIRVPREMPLEVSTVTDGDIDVADVRGDFTVHNVNGSIELHGMAGSGEAVTVNGRVVVSFVSNPQADCHFETINGKVDVAFQAGLSADLELDARWGELWSEYEVQPLPAAPPVSRKKDGRTVIETRGGTRVRVSAGGPTHSFETLNGNIYVRKGTSERGDDDA